MFLLWNLLFKKNKKHQPTVIQNIEHRLKPKHKLILTGNSEVGKTNILHIMVCKMFIPGLDISTSTDFLNVEIPVKQEFIQTYKQNVKAVAQVWDVVSFKKLTMLGKAFYRGADAGIIVYDILNLQSFKDVPFFVKDFK
jgi:Ras-related protein Rab-7A